MKIIDPGHIYELQWLDGEAKPMTVEGFIPPDMAADISRDFPGSASGDGLLHSFEITANRLVFVKREGEKYPGNAGSHPGTIIQEVLRACIDRLKYLDKQEHDVRNEDVIDSLRQALWLLECRAAERHGRLNTFIEQMLGWSTGNENGIETVVTCETCGHILCEGHK